MGDMYQAQISSTSFVLDSDEAPISEAIGGAGVKNPTPPSGRGKQRLKWTGELHDRFVDSITQLRGPDKATPKGVLKMMNVPGLTIYHIKSHLQKYRLAKYLPESPSDGKDEKKDSADGSSHKDSSKGTEMSEALRIQTEVQKRLTEQLEVQRKLQMRIEAQGRYLYKIIEEQQKLGNTLKASETLQLADQTDKPSGSDSPPTLDASVHPPSPPHKRLRLDDSLPTGISIAIAPPLIPMPVMTDPKCASFLDQWDQDSYGSGGVQT